MRALEMPDPIKPSRASGYEFSCSNQTYMYWLSELVWSSICCHACCLRYNCMHVMKCQSSRWSEQVVCDVCGLGRISLSFAWVSMLWWVSGWAFYKGGWQMLKGFLRRLNGKFSALRKTLTPKNSLLNTESEELRKHQRTGAWFGKKGVAYKAVTSMSELSLISSK